MTERTLTFRAFGDPLTVAVRFDDAGHVVEVAPVSGSERCRDLARSVGRALAGGRSLVQQQHTLAQLGDIVRALLDAQDAAVVEARQAKAA